jgi:hypothetical protein
MRLAALGTTALALTVVLLLMASSLFFPVMVGLPAWPRPFQAAAFADEAVDRMEAAADREDWFAANMEQKQAASQMAWTTDQAAKVSAMSPPGYKPAMDRLGKRLNGQKQCLQEAGEAIKEQDRDRLRRAIEGFRRPYSATVKAEANPDK